MNMKKKKKRKLSIPKLVIIFIDDNRLMECSIMFMYPHTAVDIGISGSSISHTLVESSL